MGPRAGPVPAQSFSKPASGPAPSARYNFSSAAKMSSTSRSVSSSKQSAKASFGGGKGMSKVEVPTINIVTETKLPSKAGWAREEDDSFTSGSTDLSSNVAVGKRNV